MMRQVAVIHVRSPASSRYASPMRRLHHRLSHKLSHQITVVVTALATASLLTGCLSNGHIIPRQDLQALAQTNAQTRSQRVRVVQAFASEDSPPPAPHADGGTSVYVGVHTPVRVRSRSSGSVGSGGGNTAKSKSDEAWVWIVIAAAVAIGAAATEGARYDGWVALHPNHPVHLYGWDGSYTWVPLSSLTPEQAAWAQKALVRPSEGPWTELGRAPLNRQGWTYAVLLGSSEFPDGDGSVQRGFTSHIQFGRFTSRQFGILLDVSMGWAEDALQDRIYDSRTSLELQFMPVGLGKLHAGVFGQAGLGYRLDDRLKGADRQGLLAGAGGMLQLELTTRLALTARAGLTSIYSDTTSDFTVGISIY